jgi:heptosyltransferase-2
VSTPEKVLVIRFGSLGDVVLATAVIEALARERPAPETHLVTKAAHAPLFEDDRRVARVVAHDGGLARLLAAVRRERYGRVLDLHANPRSRLVAFAARADEKRTVDKRSRERRALLWGGRAASPRLAGGVVSWYGETLGAVLPEPRLAVSRGGRAEADAILQGHGLEAGFVAVLPGARRRTKAWPRAKVETFLRAASADPATRARGLLLVGGDEDAALLHALSAATRVPLAQPRLPALPALLASAAVVVTNDSAPLHVAEAVGTPAVALFGPTVAEFGFAPRGPRSVRLEIDLPCRPCTLHGGDACPLGHHACLEEIDPDRVLAAALSILAGGARPASAELSHGRV